MNSTPRETLKSLTIGLAALIGLVLWLKFQPKPPADWTDRSVGESLCAGFTDPSLSAELTIIRPGKAGDSEPSESSLIRLIKEKGEWVVQTAENAPADNTDRFTMVLAPLLRLTLLSEIKEINHQSDESVIKEFHKSCNLLDPSDSSSSEMKDAGIRLTVTGSEGEKFVDLIIGGLPEGSSEVRDIRYVRFPGDKRVFTTDFSGEGIENAGEEKPLPYTERLSVNPADWMNRDLLRISRWNILRMTVFEYDVNTDGKTKPIRIQTFAQDKNRSLGRVWEQVRLTSFDNTGKPEETEITEANQFPDNEPLNAEVDLISHLQFKSLLRKPEGLISLIAQNRPEHEWTEFTEQLKAFGFYFADHDPADSASVTPILIGRKGTLSLTMNDGVKLRILFGADLPEKGEAVLVIPALDETSFTKPELKEIPEGASETEAKAITDDNRIKENEYNLNLAEAKTKLDHYKNRFTNWIFFIDNPSEQIEK